MNTLRAQPWGYLAREAGLILVWSYGLLVGGTVNGLIAFGVQAASAGLLAVAVALWWGWRWRQSQGRLPRTGLEWAAGLYVLAQLAAALLSQDVRRSLPVVAQTIGYLLIFYLAFDLTRAGWPAELTEKALLIVGGIVLGLGLLDVLQAGLNWLALVAGQTYAPAFVYRLYAPLGDANLIAACVNVMLPFAVARLVTTTRPLMRAILGGWLAAALVVQVFTSSRGGQLGLVVVLGTLALVWVGWVSPQAQGAARRAWAQLRARPLVLALVLVLGLGGAGALVGRALLLRTATQAPALFARQEFWPAAVAGFQASPLWGRGPGTYPSEFMRANSVPPQRPFLHAHSVPLNLAAESGLIGLAAAAAGLAAIAWALWRARGAAEPAGRARWAAVAASWAGFLVHSQVDDHTRYLAVALPLGVMLACVLAESGKAETSARGFHPVWLVLPGLAAGALAVYSLRAYALAEDAVAAAGAGDWALAAHRLDAAAAADPGLAFYWEQAGYAYSRLAEDGQAEALNAAIDRLERGATLEPGYAVTHANLAAVYWQAGRRVEAVAALERAVTLAPGAAFLHLNLGQYKEDLGDAAAAHAAYRAALDRNRLLAGASFWAATPLREGARAEWLAAQPAGETTVVEQTRRLIGAGRVDEAERGLIELWRQDRQALAVYLGLAEVARVRGDLAAAARYAEQALWVQTVQIDQQVDALLLAAEISQARGETEAAAAGYQAAFNAVSAYGSLGWGSYGWTPHAFFVYQRRGLPLDVAPQLVRADFTQALGRRLLPLGTLYVELGQPEKAAAFSEQLLQLDPTLAQQRLEAP